MVLTRVILRPKKFGGETEAAENGILLQVGSPTFVKIIKQKAVQEFKPDPYIATVLNCAMWSFYGLPIIKEDSILVTTINSIGLLIEIIYVSIFFIFSPINKQRKIAIALTVEVIFVVAVIVVSMMAFSSPKKRAMFVGILCIILNVIMYASQLTVMVRFSVCTAYVIYFDLCFIYLFMLQRMVIKTKSVKYMPFFLSLANSCNGIVWVIYALLKFDVNVVVPNGLGAISGLIQIILYAKYYKTTRWDNEEDNSKEKPEVQLYSTV
ncbi:bidirectional sugar transporter SWEET5-like [Hevea brasiliensis]|uniref:bidirectional sugar transporter SWEET5-like n=1 Tax=Hevea brasiliensis TaxID=3981 RepID=UPI0025E792F8|nr:bidirectional sugar transporter SWEET5-like [Hevea brasiliensis]